MINHNINQFGIGEIERENSVTIGETIETKIERITKNNEPITDGAPLIYMDRRDGVSAAHDIRTDRWDIAIDAMDVVAKTKISKRMEVVKQNTQGTEPPQPAA